MAALRLRRVRFKSGGTLEVLRPRTDGMLEQFNTNARLAAETSGDMAGYAIVAWRPNGKVFVTYGNGDRSLVPGGGVPQYVKDVLLAEVAVRWSRD